MKKKLFKIVLVGGLLLSGLGFVNNVEASVLSVSGVNVTKINNSKVTVNKTVQNKVYDNKTVQTLKNKVVSSGYKIENTKGYEGAIIKNSKGLIVLHVNTSKKVVFVNSTADSVQRLGANVVKIMSSEKNSATNIYNSLNKVIKNNKVTKANIGKVSIVETQNLQVEMIWK